MSRHRSPYPLIQNNGRIRRCLSCGTTADMKRRRYCSIECRQKLRHNLNIRTGLLQALQIRYATFYFTEHLVILDMLPYGSTDLASFIFPRAREKSRWTTSARCSTCWATRGGKRCAAPRSATSPRASFSARPSRSKRHQRGSTAGSPRTGAHGKVSDPSQTQKPRTCIRLICSRSSNAPSAAKPKCITPIRAAMPRFSASCAMPTTSSSNGRKIPPHHPPRLSRQMVLRRRPGSLDPALTPAPSPGGRLKTADPGC